jgi:uncharacterized protein YfdQ (DUF2303 family)
MTDDTSPHQCSEHDFDPDPQPYPHQVSDHVIDLIRELTLTSGTNRIEGSDGNAHQIAFNVPPGWNIQTVDPEQWAPAPYHKQGTAVFHQPASFLNYIDQQDGSPPIYCNKAEARFTAVFDDDDADGPGWRRHRAELMLHQTDEWVAITNSDGVGFYGTDLADWLEEWAHIIVQPELADLIMIIRKFRATAKMTFRSDHCTTSGDTVLEYRKETKAGGGDSIEIPETITFALPIHEGSPRMPVKALFRYRVKDDTVKFHYKLVQATKEKRDDVKRIADYLSSKQNRDIMYGKPAEPRA